MTHQNAALVARAYQALNQRDLDGFMSAFADDAVLYGADGPIEGKEAILSVIRQLIGLSENSLEIDVHDILANDDHTVVLQTTKAQLGERILEDRVVYVFHMNEVGLIRDAYLTGDRRVQEEFYGLT
jgi:ketosteroid isomerase-like protein